MYGTYVLLTPSAYVYACMRVTVVFVCVHAFYNCYCRLAIATHRGFCMHDSASCKEVTDNLVGLT